MGKRAPSQEQAPSQEEQAPSQLHVHTQRGKKRKGFASHLERAATYLSAEQPGRVPLGKTGAMTYDCVIPMHVHMDLLPDILTHGTQASRYAPVKMVEVPRDALAKWRRDNKAKSEHPLMPQYSPEMCFCLLTKKNRIRAQSDK